MKEYERKFIILEPEKVWNMLQDTKSVEYERYFLYIGEDGQVRAQRKGDKYTIESIFGNYRKKVKITEDAFAQLTRNCDKVIKRSSYQLSDEIKLKVYKEQYKGLFIVDIEFPDKEAYYTCKKPHWIGPEITSTKLGTDGKIIQLSPEEVFNYINNLKKSDKSKDSQELLK